MKNIWFLRLIIACLFVSCAHNKKKEESNLKDSRPNILWITIEDWSPDLSCYGTKGISTPNVDKLASEGIRYENAFTTSPVCSTSRSAMMTGFYQNYIGANQHRSHDKKPLPFGIKPIPHLLKEAGYYTSIMSWKTDCNFIPNTRGELFTDTSDYTKDGKIGWRNREKGQPFFARVTFGGTHRSWRRDPENPIDIKDVEIPPYYVDNEFIRRDWANGLEQMQLVDRQIGELLQKLEDDGLADNTIVFFIGDHGRCHIRGKQFLYDGGIHIPMIMKYPGKVKPNQVNNNMVMSIDICATILEAAGVTPNVALHGKSLFSKDVKNRKYVFAARDKMDETHDAIRAIRSKEFKLIHNLMPERPWCQLNQYKESAYPVLAEMNILNLKGKLNPVQAAFFAPTKPEFELFDLSKDPFEINNVANNSEYADIKLNLLSELNNWRENVINDKGVSDEFRALGIFPDLCPTATVGEWVILNQDKYDFNKYGWPAWYPTRTLEEWEKARAIWEPYVLRSATDEFYEPVISFTKNKNKKKKK
ncbi:sulfatase family protein [Lutibacter citreus]|uniref:sulfatase family protein n=1 Tax=Lutibacter citreus TaxID=2138210 RepID=UPI000DBE835A|nr:sulfatase [Lutibacter citreus]